MADKYRCGIVLAHVGVPVFHEKREIDKFYRRYFSSKRIRIGTGFTWWLKLRSGVLVKHTDAYREKKAYLEKRQGIPFGTTCTKVASALDVAFKGKAKVMYGGCFDQPNIQSALEKLRLFGCTELFVLPLYPQSSHITTGTVHDAVEHSLKKIKWDTYPHFIDNYHDNPTYIKALAASIRHSGFDADSDDRLLFSYQSIPTADIEAGDTFELQVGASSLQIASELGIERNRWTIGYQNTLDSQREWLAPTSEETIRRWAEGGSGKVFFVCPGYAVESVETLYDAKYYLRSVYNEVRKTYGKSYGREEYSYSPCLDQTKAHIKVLTDVLRPYVEGAG